MIFQDENGKSIPSEVAIMLRLQDKNIYSKTKAAPVSLLDWYETDSQIILVIERPIPCKDMFDYIQDKGGKLEEEETKVATPTSLQPFIAPS